MNFDVTLLYLASFGTMLLRVELITNTEPTQGPVLLDYIIADYAFSAGSTQCLQNCFGQQLVAGRRRMNVASSR